MMRSQEQLERVQTDTIKALLDQKEYLLRKKTKENYRQVLDNQIEERKLFSTSTGAMSVEELRINYAEIEAMNKIPISQLTQHSTQTPLMPVRVKYDVAANLMKDLKKARLKTMTGTQ